MTFWVTKNSSVADIVNLVSIWTSLGFLVVV